MAMSLTVPASGASLCRVWPSALPLLAALTCLPLTAACGLQRVELLPGASERSADAGDIVQDSAPSAAVERLRADPNTTGDEALQLLYPAPPLLIVPADLAPMELQWQAGASKPAAGPMPAAPPPTAGMPAPAPPEPMKADPMKMDKAKADADPVLAYELRAHSDQANERMYVTDLRASFPRERWSALLRQHIGSTLRFDLRGVRKSGAIVHANGVELRVRGPLPAGSFYSFSTTAQGLMRGEISRTHERRVVPGPGVAGAPDSGCVGCHALSSDGQRGLAAVSGKESLFTWSLASNEAVLTLEPAAAASGGYVFGALDATASRIARVQAGRLSIFNADTGALLQQSPAPLMAASSAPDWSPDARTIALILQSDNGEPEGRGGTLASVSVALDGSMSDPRTLVSAAKDESLYWPVFSPDGAWIAYERRKGPARDAKDARIFVVRASGGDPTELAALRDKPMSDAGAPAFVRTDVPEQVYLVFGSHRAVGSFMPEDGQRQLFASALDLSLAAAGRDPSSPAFWLPFQQRSSSYLRAQWAPAQRMCSATDEVTDGTDDDCDGKIDEDSCTPAAESCGNQQDDDCDGASDEGCGCGFIEQCDNQKDDDCDLHVDEQPCVPAPPGK